MAQNGPPDGVAGCPLSGGDQTSGVLPSSLRSFSHPRYGRAVDAIGWRWNTCGDFSSGVEICQLR